jgi:hypothetical protein
MSEVVYEVNPKSKATLNKYTAKFVTGLSLKLRLILLRISQLTL